MAVTFRSIGPTPSMNIICLLFVFCLQNSAANRLSMPVMVIDSEHVLFGVNVPDNPFHKMSPMTFSEILRNGIERSERILLFIEDHFSVEDVTTKDKLGTPYYYLHLGVVDHNAIYIPSVIEPFRAIKHIFPPLESNVFYLSNTLQSFDSNFKYYYIFFQDQGFNETRVEKLRRHDKIMRTVCLTVRQLSPGPVVAFYTGKSNPMLPMGNVAYFPQELPPAEPEPPVNLMIVTDGALFRLSSVYSTSGSRRALQPTPTVGEQVMSRRRLMTRMLYSDFELEFDFLYHQDGWTLDTVSLLEGGEEVGRTKMEVGAPWDVSYYCAAPMMIVNTRDQSAVIISTYQIEPLLSRRFGQEFRRQVRVDTPPLPDPTTQEPETTSEGTETTSEGTETTTVKGQNNGGKTDFNETNNCQPYFSPQILSGLMVSGLVLSITMYGVVTLYNCNTNSRFDDPNSKPLVIVPQL